MTAEIPSTPHVRLELLSQPRLLSAVRAMMNNVAERLGFDSMQCTQISLAVDEALCNVINHGYGKRDDGSICIEVRALDGTPGGIHIVIEDRARQVDPSKIQPRDLDEVRPGGLGVYLIREIMDEVTYEPRQDDGMRLTLVKYRTHSDQGPTASDPECRAESEKTT